MKIAIILICAIPISICFAQESFEDLSLAYSEVENHKLILDIETSNDLSSVNIKATFEFSFKDKSVPVYFMFPDVEDSSEFAEIVLDGRVVSNEKIRKGSHPIYHRKIFIVAQDLIDKTKKLHRLTVKGPARQNEEPHYTHWGGWHPFLIDRTLLVPIEANITTDPDYTVVCSGENVREIVDGNRLTSQWHTILPQGWMFLSIGKYNQTRHVKDSISFSVYWPQDHSDFNPSDVTRYPTDVINYYTEQFGPSNIKSYRFIEIPEEEVHNFSVNGLVAVSYGSYEKWKENPLYLVAIMAHEIAHYWWGDTVIPSEEGEKWLSEAFAEYSRYLYERDNDMEPISWRYRNLIMLSKFADRNPPGLLSDQETTSSGEEVYYQKGSYVLHMFEQLIGQEMFMRILKHFVASHRGKHVTVEDFFQSVYHITGKRHHSFFSQWLNLSTGPQVDFETVELIDGKDGGYRVKGTITQMSPTYNLILPIQVVYDENDSEDFELSLEHEYTSFDFQLEKRPMRILLDPDNKIFKWFPESKLPIDFAEVHTMMQTNPHVKLEGYDSLLIEQPQSPNFVSWFYEQFPKAELVMSNKNDTHKILFGQNASDYRENHDLSHFYSDDPDRLRVFVHRNQDFPETFIVGIEGKIPETWPYILPQGPYQYIELKNGQYVKIFASALPVVQVSF